MLITRGAGELASAQRIQAALLPGDEQVMGFEIAGRCRFAHEVGGDHIFVRKCGPGHLQLVVADVSGKGVSAAFLVMKLDTLLRTNTDSTARSPSRTAEKLNRDLSRMFARFEDCFFVTALIGVLRRGGEFSYVSAGHPGPILLSHSDARTCPTTASLPLGLGIQAEYPLQHVKLARGDLLLQISDGVAEARDAQGEFAEPTALLRGLRGQAARDVATAVLERVDEHRCGESWQDDVAVLAVRRR